MRDCGDSNTVDDDDDDDDVPVAVALPLAVVVAEDPPNILFPVPAPVVLVAVCPCCCCCCCCWRCPGLSPNDDGASVAATARSPINSLLNRCSTLSRGTDRLSKMLRIAEDEMQKTTKKHVFVVGSLGFPFASNDPSRISK